MCAQVSMIASHILELIEWLCRVARGVPRAICGGPDAVEGSLKGPRGPLEHGTCHDVWAVG
jgi:hypothetical protein